MKRALEKTAKRNITLVLVYGCGFYCWCCLEVEIRCIWNQLNFLRLNFCLSQKTDETENKTMQSSAANRKRKKTPKRRNENENKSSRLLANFERRPTTWREIQPRFMADGWEGEMEGGMAMMADIISLSLSLTTSAEARSRRLITQQTTTTESVEASSILSLPVQGNARLANDRRTSSAQPTFSETLHDLCNKQQWKRTAAETEAQTEAEAALLAERALCATFVSFKQLTIKHWTMARTTSNQPTDRPTALLHREQ